MLEKRFFLILTILTILAISVGQPLFCQDTLPPDIYQTHKVFFAKQRENFHLHLSKTDFLKGENIWFAAYVYEQNQQLPSLETSNLYVGIYDAQGRELQRKQIYIENGVGHGDIMVDSALSKGFYYIKAYTNWMKNFKTKNSFIQKIRILDVGDEFSTVSRGDAIEVQLLPEGGHILKNASNTVGFKISDSMGSGVKISGAKLIDKNGITIQENIGTNEMGFGKFTFFQKQKLPYCLKLVLNNGRIIEKSLPEVLDKGIVFSVNVLNPDKILFTANTNSETLEEDSTEYLYISFNKNDKLIVNKFILNDTVQTISIPKNVLPTGVNTLTLFDSSLRPFANRLFFNDYGLVIPKLNIIEQPSNKRDTIQISLNLPYATDTSLFLSVSVLPSKTVANNPDNTIYSSFWLMPYLRNPVENPSYYFKCFDRIKQYELDLMLLVQGWGSYNWKNIFENPPKSKFIFEKGITVKGLAMDADLSKEKWVWLNDRTLNGATFAELKKNKRFETNSVFYKNDSLAVALVDGKGKLRAPEVELQFEPRIEKDFFDFSEYQSVDSGKETPLIDLDTALFRLPENAIQLDEVLVTERKKQKINKDHLVGADFSGKSVTDDDVKKYKSLTAYLRTIGFSASMVTGEGSNPFPRLKVMNSKYPFNEIALLVDGVYSEGNEIRALPLSRVQSIFYDGMKSSVIVINLRWGPYDDPDAPKKYITALISNGYARPQKYYNPGYERIDAEFQKYGAVHWESQIDMIDGKSKPITFPSMNQDSITIFIEGMGLNGTLISTIKTIQLN